VNATEVFAALRPHPRRPAWTDRELRDALAERQPLEAVAILGVDETIERVAWQWCIGR
jgi:hypothetical protein